ncbi:MAG TPA: HPr family phosphocarrier protein [Candidatus Eisenbergiella merdavium]|uniref:HPr family phosphocarrier protein n=1 Tax=Candidatus Eisenbergiella merdavium TaxID=2838551 RepID=A0A9D2SQD6_9FIRM|nr:HPr family phosphocarrier protein [Candidatus Eisenbergiella merdavium]
MESVKIFLKTPEDAENFVQTMRQFEGEYDLILGSVTVDAKSILGVFALGIGKEFELIFVNPREEREDVLNAVKKYCVTD